MKIEVTLISGNKVYAQEKSLEAFRAYVNSAASRGAACYEAFADESLTVPVVIVLNNVESFKAAN